ncbi:MAG: hypothetical protein HYZ51_02810 [Candidatus Doudnabacteria bacterium]|nr:hypothetical protein [Candidatus Doudnabacteria bacterium]
MKDSIVGEELKILIKEELNIKEIVEYLSMAKKEKVSHLSGTAMVADFILDLNITPELKKEGHARELERLVQDLRRKSGLKVAELADLYYNTQNVDLEQILLSQVDRKKTFIGQIAKHAEVEPDFESQGEVEGVPIWLGIVRI